jgi:transcriptional regulator with XRE-family HTH domain
MSNRIQSIATKKNIGWILRERRLSKGISQSELCKKVNISQTFLSLVEHGKKCPSYEVLENISGVLGEKVEDLEREANDNEIDPGLRVMTYLNKLVRKGNNKKLAKILDFIESLG